MENDLVQVTLLPDGTFDLLDKRTAAHYRRQNRLQDRGDGGDLYVSRLLDDGIRAPDRQGVDQARPTSATTESVTTCGA